jgi:hypothetical protein
MSFINKCVNCLENDAIITCPGCQQIQFCSETCMESFDQESSHAIWCSLDMKTDRVKVCYDQEIDEFYVEAIERIPRLSRIAICPAVSSGSKSDKTSSFCNNDGILPNLPPFEHSCFPNAGFIYDNWNYTVVIYAEKEIHPGERISLNFSCFYDFDDWKDPIKNAEDLKSKYGLSCGESCRCKSVEGAEHVAMIKEVYKKDKSLMSCLANGEKLEAERLSREIVTTSERLELPSAHLYRAYFDLFQILNGSEESRSEAVMYANKCVALIEPVLAPTSLVLKQIKKYAENPVSHMSAKISQMLKDQNGQLQGFDLFGGGSDDEFYF